MTTKEKLIPISEVKKMIDEVIYNPKCFEIIRGFEELNKKLDAWAKEQTI